MISCKKEKPHRDPKYLAYLRTLPCACCNAYPPSEAAHQRLLSGGIALKPHDRHAIPMCRGCHDYDHRHGPVKLWTDNLPGNFECDKHSLREYLRDLCEAYYFEWVRQAMP